MAFPMRFWKTCVSCALSTTNTGSWSAFTTAPLSCIAASRFCSADRSTTLQSVRRCALPSHPRKRQQVLHEFLHSQCAVDGVVDVLVRVLVELAAISF